MIKSWLAKTLTKQQYKALSKLKNNTADFRYRLAQSPFLMAGSIVKILPQNSQVTLKSGINIVKKMDYERQDIFMAIDSDFEYRVRLHSCKKEPETVEWIERYVKENEVFYDIGANNGAFSLVASKSLGGKVSVYAFEPAFLNFTQLCKNLILNDCQEKILPFQIALSDATTIENFHFYNLTPGGAIHALGEAVDFTGKSFTPVSSQPVLRYRLDDFIDQFAILPPNHIKIDVDGTEYSVIKGMEATLERGSVQSMMVELNEGRGHVPQIIEYLSGKGYKVEAQFGINYLFLRYD